MDLVAIKVKYLNADGAVTTSPIYVKATCTMHAEGATGTIEFHDTATTPDVGATPKCKLDVVGKGVYSLQIPLPGALFERGLYVKVPAGTSMNIFYTDAGYDS
jgi:hypothetical protein